MFAQLTDLEILAEIGRRLKAHRLQQNIPIEVLASRAGLSKTTVVRAEEGKNPTLITLLRILRQLGKLGALENFIPEPRISPLQLLERGGKGERKHAYRAK